MPTNEVGDHSLAQRLRVLEAVAIQMLGGAFTSANPGGPANTEIDMGGFNAPADTVVLLTRGLDIREAANATTRWDGTTLYVTLPFDSTGWTVTAIVSA